MNNKYCGNPEDFALVREDGGRTVISYDLQNEPDGQHVSWREVVFYKKQTAKPTIEQVKQAIIADINARTDEKILTGFVWNDTPVWLSEENQRNFSEAQRIALLQPEAILPVTFKLGEQTDGTPVYHKFETAEELTGFYLQAVAFINQALADGWAMKDGMDWDAYAAIIDPDYVVPKKKTTKK